jgi:hypothetical protein
MWFLLTDPPLGWVIVSEGPLHRNVLMETGAQERVIANEVKQSVF